MFTPPYITLPFSNKTVFITPTKWKMRQTFYKKIKNRSKKMGHWNCE
jgi:hypothetical protein